MEAITNAVLSNKYDDFVCLCEKEYRVDYGSNTKLVTNLSDADGVSIPHDIDSYSDFFAFLKTNWEEIYYAIDIDGIVRKGDWGVMKMFAWLCSIGDCSLGSWRKIYCQIPYGYTRKEYNGICLLDKVNDVLEEYDALETDFEAEVYVSD